MRFAQVFSNRQDASPLLREISSGKLPEHLDPLLEIESFTEVSAFGEQHRSPSEKIIQAQSVTYRDFTLLPFAILKHNEAVIRKLLKKGASREASISLEQCCQRRHEVYENHVWMMTGSPLAARMVELNTYTVIELLAMHRAHLPESVLRLFMQEAPGSFSY